MYVVVAVSIMLVFLDDGGMNSSSSIFMTLQGVVGYIQSMMTSTIAMGREKATSQETKKATSSASTGLVMGNIRQQYCPVHDDHFSRTSSVRRWRWVELLLLGSEGFGTGGNCRHTVFILFCTRGYISFMVEDLSVSRDFMLLVV
jgi:hypothetical protein